MKIGKAYIVKNVYPKVLSVGDSNDSYFGLTPGIEFIVLDIKQPKNGILVPIFCLDEYSENIVYEVTLFIRGSREKTVVRTLIADWMYCFEEL